MHNYLELQFTDLHDAHNLVGQVSGSVDPTIFFVPIRIIDFCHYTRYNSCKECSVSIIFILMIIILYVYFNL